MSILVLKRKNQQKKHQDILCEAGGLAKREGYIGKVDCKKKMLVYPMELSWEGRYPNPYTSCGGGNRSKDPRCAVVAPGASHPGVVMMDNYTYKLNIDIL